MPDIIRSFKEMMPHYRTIPPLETLNLSGVLNSYVRCRICRGERIIAVKSDVSNTFTYTRCFHCQGSGIMSNRESSYVH